VTNLIAGSVRSVRLPEQETDIARISSRLLADFDVAGPPLMLRLENPQTGQHLETTVPATVVQLLADMLARMAEGQAVTLIPLHAELSTQQAADLLNVSRPYFIKLLEDGKMPFRKVGEQRRVRYQDLLPYMETYQKAANSALEEMTAEAEQLGLYA
jgi:excisionase family DNA binding protein